MRYAVIAAFVNLVAGSMVQLPGGKPRALRDGERVTPPARFDSSDKRQTARLLAARVIRPIDADEAAKVATGEEGAGVSHGEGTGGGGGESAGGAGAGAETGEGAGEGDGAADDDGAGAPGGEDGGAGEGDTQPGAGGEAAGGDSDAGGGDGAKPKPVGRNTRKKPAKK